VQDALPIWVGGSSHAAMRRAAERGDGWLPQGPPEEGMEAGIAYVRAHRAATRGDDPIVIGALSGPLHVGEPSWDTGRCVRGPAEKVAAYLRTYRDLGVDQIQVGFASRSADELCDQIAAFAAEVAPLVNEEG
jgi:alkanesulfonate monooxygenase SsuD/methylene tetrahydromethanopterin reductase-like flavin-dependent oxidoreductase (luciferase family)